MLTLQLRGLEKRFMSMEKMYEKNTQIFQETISLMDIRQGLMIRRLRMSVIGLQWEEMFAEYAAVVAILQFIGRIHEPSKSRLQEQLIQQNVAPEGAVVFGG
jgi:hypothetical protein